MNRDQYVKKLKEELDRWNAQAELWEAKAKLAKDNVRARYEQQLEALAAVRGSAEQRLREVQSTSGAAWQEIARGADRAWEEVRAAFERVRAQFERDERKDAA